MATDETSADRRRFFVAVLFSAAFFVLGAWIVLGSYDPQLQKLACGWLGLILGYWLS
ncbi:MAG: hypothetical protein M3321_03445 [Actinomycetota bacterium]|nr:hypothetical protein [Actinomycetota bacterium]